MAARSRGTVHIFSLFSNRLYSFSVMGFLCWMNLIAWNKKRDMLEKKKKIKFCRNHLLTHVLFYTHINYFLKWNIKVRFLKNILHGHSFMSIYTTIFMNVFTVAFNASLLNKNHYFTIHMICTILIFTVALLAAWHFKREVLWQCSFPKQMIC